MDNKVRTTRDLLSEADANLVLKYGFEVMDAEAFIDNAPMHLVRRVARRAGRIDRLTIWEQQSDEDAWAITMPNTRELMAEWRASWFNVSGEKPDG